MSELYCRNNFCVAAGRFLSVGEDNENEIILTFTDETRNVTRACFNKTDSAFSNYNKLQRIKSHLREGDLFAVAGYKNEAGISAHRFAIWSGTFFHDKLVDESGRPLTVVIGKIRGDYIGEPRNSVMDPSGKRLELLDFSMFVNDRAVRGLWNIRISGNMVREHACETRPYRGAVVIGREIEPKGYAHRLIGTSMMTVEFPLKATA